MSTPNSNITVALARSEDAEAIADAQFKTWLTTYPNKEHGLTESYVRDRLNTRTPEERCQGWRDRIADPDYLMLVAKQDGQVVGFTNSVKKPPRHELCALYVLPEYQSQGAGSQLISKVIEWFGNEDISLTVATYNTKAQAAYRKFGFEITGPAKDVQAERLGIKPIPEYWMIRKAKA